MTKPFDWSQLDRASLTPEQHEEWLASPMSEDEQLRLKECEAVMTESFKAQLASELEHGKLLKELKEHPSLLWQRDEMFRTKTGRWKKSRKWHDYVNRKGLAESGKEADRLIKQYESYVVLKEISI